jgi:hypothetical protein
MSLKRISAVLFAVGGALGCSTYSTYRPVALDCTLDNGYVLDPIDMTTAFTYGDPTPGALATATVTMLPDGARCTSMSALQITTHRFNDWGAAVSFYGFHAAAPVTFRDASASEGLAFWARAPGATGKAFTVVLDDYNTNDPTPLAPGSTDPSTDLDPTDSNCVSYSGPDGGSQTISSIDPMTGAVISSGSITVTPPNACGNGYSFVPRLTPDWQFFAIPFNAFHQSNMPNRVPNGTLKEEGSSPGTSLLTAKLTLLTLRMAKESDMEIWMDKLGFYRKQGGGAGADGGADAR